MAWFDRAGKLLALSPIPRGRAWRPLYALAAAAGLYVAWSALGHGPQVPSEPGDDPIALALTVVDDQAGTQTSTAVKTVNYLDGIGFNFAAGIQSGIDCDAACDAACNTACDAPCDSECDSAPEVLPTERHKRPDYVIEAPDVLSIAVRSYAADEAILESVNGEHLVEPDGSLNLCEEVGAVQVGGLTLADLPARIQDCLFNEVPDAQVSVSVSAPHSKAYYIITEGNGSGDTVMRNPALGGETVRDALAFFPDADWNEKNVWIARPARDDEGSDEILTVDVAEVLEDADSSTNYSLEPGDRVFIASPPDFWESVIDIMSSTWETLIEMFW